ncbi:MAG: hypothetical protein ACM3KF_01710 [Acidobacteriota bacterium]
MRLTPEALYYLLAGASIINTTSIQATQPSPGLLDYAANSVTMDTIKKASDAVRVQRTFNRDAPAAIPTDVKSPDSVNLTLTMVDGEHYSGLSPVQNGVLFHKICTELIADPQYSVIHAREGGGTSSVVMRCDDNISGNSLLITGWDSRTWNVPVTQATIQSYIDSVPYDAWWTDRQAVVRGFYTALMAEYSARGGTWPVTSFWDPWANEWSGVKKQELPAPDPSDSNNYCLVAVHRTYTDILYRVKGTVGTIEPGGC